MRSVSSAGPRVLVHLPNWLGDVVMTTPLLAHLDHAFAAAGTARPSLHIAVNRAWAGLFAEDARLAGCLVLDRGPGHRGVGGLWHQVRAFRQGQFDAVLICPPSLRAGLVAALAGIPLRVGQAADGRSPLLKPAVPRPARGSQHFSREMLDLGQQLLRALGLPAPALAPAALPLATLPGCAGTPAVIPGGDRPLWILAPGTTYGEAKTWPEVRVSEFLDLAVKQAGAQVALLGDAQATALAAGLRRRSRLAWSRTLSGEADVIDLTGQTSLAEVAGLLQAAGAFVGNDSGLMHLAGALGVPTVGIFGSSNPDWTRPLGPRTTFVAAAGFACRPCYRRTCNQPTFCLETVTAAAVLDKVREVLALPPVPDKVV